jgi:hypothetical protein
MDELSIIVCFHFVEKCNIFVCKFSINLEVFVTSGSSLNDSNYTNYRNIVVMNSIDAKNVFDKTIKND